ncbi:MAG: hypothetical protein ABFS56_12185 [Pseudomonadota bacterium]
MLKHEQVGAYLFKENSQRSDFRHNCNFRDFNVEYRALIFSTRKIKPITNKRFKELYLEYPNGLKHQHLRAG